MTDAPGDEIPGEPTGTTIDGTPWEEPRPPHLPDTVTGLPVATILFTLGALVVGFVTIRDAIADAPSDPGSLIQLALSLSIPIVSFLIPAVFFLRHRDAWSAHRAMAIGTSLFAFSRGLGLLNRYLGGWFDSVLPPPSDQPWLNPFSIAMQIAVTAAAVFALIYMARGLVQARLYADQPGTRRWWALVALVAAVSSVMTAFLFSTMSPELEGDAFASYYWLTLLGVVLNVATVSAWAYFTGIAIAGRRAGEDPSFGWFLVAFAGSCILATFVISGMVTVMNTVSQPDSVPNVLWLITSLPAIAYLALLAAFALRLPTTHAPLDEPDEEEAGTAGPAGSDDPSEPIAAPDDLAGSTA